MTGAEALLQKARESLAAIEAAHLLEELIRPCPGDARGGRCLTVTAVWSIG